MIFSIFKISFHRLIIYICKNNNIIIYITITQKLLYFLSTNIFISLHNYLTLFNYNSFNL